MRSTAVLLITLISVVVYVDGRTFKAQRGRGGPHNLDKAERQMDPFTDAVPYYDMDGGKLLVIIYYYIP